MRDAALSRGDRRSAGFSIDVRVHSTYTPSAVAPGAVL